MKYFMKILDQVLNQYLNFKNVGGKSLYFQFIVSVWIKTTVQFKAETNPILHKTNTRDN